MCKEPMYNYNLRLNWREVTTVNPSSLKGKVMGTPSPSAQITTKVGSKLAKLWGAIDASINIHIDRDN
jgi:hypothetical protein